VFEDEDLIRGVLSQDETWLKRFRERYEGFLFDYIIKRVEEEEDVEEILQDVFLAAIYSLPSFSGKSSLQTWLISITRHEVADFYRKRKIKKILFSHLPFLEKIADQALSPEMTMEEIEMKEKIIRCFLSLNEGYCQILRLKYIEGQKTQKIAAMLGKSAKAVESSLRRARHAFVKNWRNKKLNQETWSSFDQRELSLLAQSFGLDSSSL